MEVAQSSGYDAFDQAAVAAVGTFPVGAGAGRRGADRGMDHLRRSPSGRSHSSRDSGTSQAWMP